MPWPADQAASGLARHLGLNQQAAADVAGLFTSSAATSSAVTGTAWVFFILGGVAAAAAISGAVRAGLQLSRVAGPGTCSAGLSGWPCWWAAHCWPGWAEPGLRGAGGPVLIVVVGLVGLTGFWWFTIWFLLGGRISWRGLFPAAVATAVFWVGMEAVFSVVFSGIVTSDDKKYGPIGVVFALMSWLIAIGVVIILGVVGGGRVAGTEPVVQDCLQETAAEPGRAASQEILTDRRASCVAALIIGPMPPGLPGLGDVRAAPAAESRRKHRVQRTAGDDTSPRVFQVNKDPRYRGP